MPQYSGIPRVRDFERHIYMAYVVTPKVGESERGAVFAKLRSSGAMVSAPIRETRKGARKLAVFLESQTGIKWIVKETTVL